MKTSLFDYELPEELIAYHPPEERDGGRLLVLNPDDGDINHSFITQIGKFLPPGALLVANDTKVVPARIIGRRPTGGAVEVLFVRPEEGTDESSRWITLAHANRPLRPGDKVDIGGPTAVVVEKTEQKETVVEVNLSIEDCRAHLINAGRIPLPPYIKRDPVENDKERYQTLFARYDGSVAAPTAGLHFSDNLLQSLKDDGFEIGYVTLHVGPGTFRPIASDDLGDHRMDEEQYIIDEDLVERIAKAKRDSRAVIAIGTTTVRALEGSFAQHGSLKPGAGFTDLFINPGFEFKVVDGLITNFHLPKSTLICLVSAMANREMVLGAYKEAVVEKYRFYSYGDAMFMLPRKK